VLYHVESAFKVILVLNHALMHSLALCKLILDRDWSLFLISTFTRWLILVVHIDALRVERGAMTRRSREEVLLDEQLDFNWFHSCALFGRCGFSWWQARIFLTLDMLIFCVA